MTSNTVSANDRDRRTRAIRAIFSIRAFRAIATGKTRVASWLLFAVVALAPLPFGSTEPAAIAFWCIALGLVAIAAPLEELRKPHLVLLGCAAVVVVAYAIVLYVQLASLQGPWLGLADPMWGVAYEALHTHLNSSASITRNEPYFSLGSPLVCMLALISGFLFSTDRARARGLLWVFAVSGTFYAAYGIADHLFDPSRILWRTKTAYFDSVTATFVNRNTAAVYFGSSAIVCLMLVCERIRQVLPRPFAWRTTMEWAFSKMPPDIVTMLGILLVCLAATLMAGSRAGSILSLIALIIAFIICFYRDLPRHWHMVAAAAAGCAVAAVLLQLMGEDLNARFDARGLADDGRLATWKATLHLIAQHPWFGTGQGTFVWSFPPYRSADVSMWGVWDRAHNILLELAAEMGIPLAGLVAAGWMVIFAVLTYGIRVRRRDLIIPVSSLAVAFLAVVHSLIDFSLEIPGYSIPVFALVGAGLAQSLASARR
jgi:O-antigen ligase